jgi:hypothetical protein
MPSINGFSVVQYGAPELATFAVPGTDTRLSVRKEVAPLLIGLARDFHATVEPLNPKSCWGHAPRKIRGGSAWSFHAPGIAMDLNAAAHPMGKRGTFNPSREAAVRALLTRYTYKGVRLIRWGADYHTRADEMHFEIIVPRGVALDAVHALQRDPAPVVVAHPGTTPAGHGPGAAPAGHTPGSRDLSLTNPQQSGDDVRYVQRWIGERRCGKPDGVYGTNTRDGVVWYQRMRGIRVSGVCDRETWRNMRVAPKY